MVKDKDEPNGHFLLPETVERLRPLVERGGPLFLNGDGKPYKTGNSFSLRFYRLMGFRHYRLKSRAITMLLAEGQDAKTVASITGHKTVSLLQDTYARTNEERQRKALEAIQKIQNRASPVPLKKAVA